MIHHINIYSHKIRSRRPATLLRHPRAGEIKNDRTTRRGPRIARSVREEVERRRCRDKHGQETRLQNES